MNHRSTYPAATECPQCHRMEATTVCGVCKTDKVEYTIKRYELERAARDYIPPTATNKSAP